MKPVLVPLGSGLSSVVVLIFRWSQSEVSLYSGNLGIRDTQGTVKNCPEFWGGPIFLRSISMY